MELTFDQIVKIYKAGIRRGEDESSAYEWGCSATGGRFDNLDECLTYGLKLMSDEEFKKAIKGYV